MSKMMNRRQFFIGCAVTGLAGTAWAQTPEKAKLDRIAIMTLSFNHILKSPLKPDDKERTLDILDAPEMFASHYGVHHVEVQHSHFISTELPYLGEFRARVRKAKSHINQICLEFGPLNISSPDPILRMETIDLTKEWIDHAAVLGCPRVMVNQGTLAPEVRQTAIETLKAIGEYGKSRKVFVTMENRDGGDRRVMANAAGAVTTPAASAKASVTGAHRQRAATWEAVVEVIKAAGIHANPDTGNFPDENARAAGLRAMYPLSSGSSHVHYDPQSFNEAHAINISKEAGYKGLYSIETVAANGPDPYRAVQTVLEELLRDI